MLRNDGKLGKLGYRYREYDLHARGMAAQDKQAGLDKGKRECEGKRRGVVTMEGRKAELERRKFLRIRGNEAQQWWRLHMANNSEP